MKKAHPKVSLEFLVWICVVCSRRRIGVEPMRPCPHCGNDLSPRAIFCPKCGDDLSPAELSAEDAIKQNFHNVIAKWAKKDARDRREKIFLWWIGIPMSLFGLFYLYIS